MEKQFENKKIQNRERILRSFEKNGILSHAGNKLVCDIEKLKKIEAKLTNRISKNTLLEAVGDLMVVSKEDLEKSQGKVPEEKQLYYFPKNINEAFDPESIREAKFQIDPWKERTAYSGEIVLPSGERVNSYELRIAKELYGTLKAKRDRDGVLNMWSETKGDFVPFNAHAFSESSGIVGNARRPSEHLQSRPAEFLVRHCPHLIERNLLTPADVRVYGEGSGQLIRNKREVRANGSVYINGAQYQLGKEFARRKKESHDKFSVVALSPNIAAVLKEQADGVEKIAYTFALKTADEKEAKRQALLKQGKKASTDRITFGIKEVEVVPFSFTAENKRFSHESESDYVDRIRLLTSFDFIEDINWELLHISGVSISKEFSWKEQQWLAAKANESKRTKEAILGASKLYGADFLKSFAACEYGQDIGNSLLTVAELAPKQLASALYRHFAGLVATANMVILEMSKISHDPLSEEQLSQVRENMLADSKKFITYFEDCLQKKTCNTEGITKSFDRYESASSLMLGLLHALKNNNSPIRLEEFKDFSIRVQTGETISPEDFNEMAAIYKENYKKNPAVEKKLLSEFKKLQGDPATRFYTLIHYGRIVAFDRFTDTENSAAYFGSFNVDPLFTQRALGEIMMAESLEIEASRKRIEADCDATSFISSTYIEKGFVATKYYDFEGLPSLHLVRDTDQSNNFSYKEKNEEQVIKEYIAKFTDAQPTGDTFIARGKQSVLPFDLLNKGYILTRYIKDSGTPGVYYSVFERAISTKNAKQAA